jgi:hypothetical protein
MRLARSAPGFPASPIFSKRGLKALKRGPKPPDGELHELYALSP